jgi:hypothetical protein
MKLTKEQKQRIREYLERQGLLFKPLQDEMVDHLGCDLELRMAEGHSFDIAWSQVTGEIGDNHFTQIQTEIMETINKRFNWSQGLSLLALGMLLISTVFKILHLQFTDVMLILSLILLAASLLTTSLSGVFLNRGKQGAARVLGMIAGILLMLTGYAFKLLHLPGADQILVTAVGVLIVTFVANAIYVYRDSSGHSNLLTYLHDKYTPGIERFLLLLLIPMILYKLVVILQNTVNGYAGFILLVVMFGAGLQFIAMCWRTMEQDLSKRNPLTLTTTIICSMCLVIPFLGPLVPIEARVIIIVLFSAVSGFLAYVMEGESKPISLILVCLVPLAFIGWALIWLKVVDPSAQTLFFNIPILLILTSGLFLTRKHGIMRAYMLISLASYVFEYIA